MASGTLFTHGPANVDSLLATTQSVFSKLGEVLNDQIFTKVTLLDWLNKKCKVSRSGGASILVPLMYGKNTTFQAYTADEVFDTSGQEGLTNAQFKWKNYGGTIRYLGDEIRMNAGEGRIMDLAKAKAKQATLSAADRLATDLFAATQATKKVQTLVTLVDATSNIGDVNSTTYSWWQAQVTTGGSFSGRGLSDMRAMRDTIAQQGSNGASLPDLWLTTATIMEYYEAGQVAALRYSPRDKADATMALAFAGGVVDFDPNATSGVIYALSSDALEFHIHSQANWTVGKFIEPATQDAYIAKVIWMGNIITLNRRRLGKINSVTA